MALNICYLNKLSCKKIQTDFWKWWLKKIQSDEPSIKEFVQSRFNFKKCENNIVDIKKKLLFKYSQQWLVISYTIWIYN